MMKCIKIDSLYIWVLNFDLSESKGWHRALVASVFRHDRTVRISVPGIELIVRIIR